jgi:hypothetical protein
MSVSIRVSFLITPIHCITQTEEPILLIIPVYLLSVALASIPFWFNSSEDWQTLTENPLFLQQMAMFSYGLTTIFLLLSILLVPFWQSLNSVIYNHVLDQKKKWALLGSV